MQLSVIICTHNPREDYLRRTLQAINAQTLPKEQWELLLIDNASKEPLAGQWDLSWHSHARHVCEQELGITPARLRGIHEAKYELIVFVDDDNVLMPDYLETILAIREKMPLMEVIGSGNITGEFETPPEAWMKSHLPMLALRTLPRDYWSNDPLQLGFYPCTAGMCLTKKVALAHAALLKRDSRRKWVGSHGSDMLRGEDDDLCFTAGSLGAGVGMFKALALTHLIPTARLNEDYLLRLTEGMTFSGYVLAYLWKKPVRPPVHSWRWRLGYWRMRRKMPPVERRFADARVRAEARAAEVIRAMEATAKNNSAS